MCFPFVLRRGSGGFAFAWRVAGAGVAAAVALLPAGVAAARASTPGPATPGPSTPGPAAPGPGAPGQATPHPVTPHPVTPHPDRPEPDKPKKAYALRIGIENGRRDVGPGDRLTYTIKVSNSGNADSPPLLLTQTLIPGLRLISSAPKGKVTDGRLTWSRVVPAGGTGQFSTTVQVGRLPSGTQRLAAVACATAKKGKRPIVCAADSDRLPVPAVDGSRWPWPGLWYAGAGVVAALAALLGVLARRRTLRRRQWTARL
ncbi:hypothetical protein [Sphaerisporangium dianthi]|uniref:DUF11 domain-containing protein n=1 Tax=Sphaerisporangium dianthi TaxID=1436120 RepID=A0ABV9CFR8_9ACTN